MLSDSRLDFIPHVAGVLQRAILRRGASARLARNTPTHAALLTSSMTYGLAVAGCGAYAKAFERPGT